MRSKAIKYLNSLVNDDTTKKQLDLITYIKKCVNEFAKLEEKKKEIPKEYISVFDFWNTQKIITHKEMTEQIIKAFEKCFKKYKEEEIKTYIERYKKVISDQTYFFDYKWTLAEFLSRRDGISAFTDEGSKWVSYNNQKRVVKQGEDFSRHEYSKEELNSHFVDLENLDEVEL